MQNVNFIRNRECVKALINKVDSLVLPDGRTKLVLHVSDQVVKQQEYKISDAIIQDKKEIKIKGLWLPKSTTTLSYTSTIGRVLLYYNILTTIDLANLIVDLIPDQNNYLVLVGCHLNY